MKRKNIAFIYQIIIFIFLIFYFTQISPLQPFDADDWRYIGSMRLPLPLWGAWNPSRVLAETLMPLGGYIAAFIIYPFTNNYLFSLSFAESLIVSAFIIIMFYLFYNFLVKRFKLTQRCALAGELLFFLSCFLLFKHINAASYTVFWTFDLSCDFYYLIPGLLNASMVLYILQYDDFISAFKNFSSLKKGLFILGVYFAIFSSSQLNIILATVVFMQIVSYLINSKISNSSFVENLIRITKRTYVYILILILWLIGISFELSGQRAANRSQLTKGTFVERLDAVFSQFNQLLKSTNVKILILFALIILLSIIIEIFLHPKRQQSILRLDFLKINITSIICLTLSFVYLILAYLKAGDIYASRPDAMWPVIFFFLFSANFSAIYIINEIGMIKPLLPFILVIGSLVAFNFNYPPLYLKNTNHDPATIRNVNNYIINQIKLADKKGKVKTVVRVPFDNPNAITKLPDANWPHSYAMGTYLQDTLYNHHITRVRMHIIFRPDKSVNSKLYENSSEQQSATPIE